MKHRNGFTLIELMIVVAICGILLSIAIPKFQQLMAKCQKEHHHKSSSRAANIN